MIGHDRDWELNIAKPARNLPIRAPQRMRVQLGDFHLKPAKVARKGVAHSILMLLYLDFRTRLLLQYWLGVLLGCFALLLLRIALRIVYLEATGIDLAVAFVAFALLWRLGGLVFAHD